jgi:Protein of unknown function (DUF4230)
MFKYFLPSIILILIVTGIFLILKNINQLTNVVKQGPVTISSLPDKRSIITNVRSLNRIETISEDVQREFDLNLDFGKLEIFGVSIDNKKDQRIQVTGKVIAGIDTSKIKEEDVEIDNKNLNLKLPAPEIFSVELSADKLAILNNSSTLLYKIQNLDSNKNREADEKIKKEVLSQAQNYLSQGACENGILVKANENSIKVIQELYSKVGFTVNVTTNNEYNCQKLSIPKLF